jgi:hypothetical protein
VENSPTSRRARRVGALAVLAILVGANQARGQEPDVPTDALIRLQRTSCYGPCPVYTVTIDARGTVTYEGERAVRVLGRQTARVHASVVTKLLEKAAAIRFFEMRASYRAIENPDGSVTTVTDRPTQFVTVTMRGRTHTVEDYVAAPDSLEEFEGEIDVAAGTKRWVFLDQASLEELNRSGWSKLGVAVWPESPNTSIDAASSQRQPSRATPAGTGS